MLLDTSGLLCLHHKAEPFHELAREFYQTANRRLTNNYVLAEYIALATARRFLRQTTLAFIADLLRNPDIEVIWVDERLNKEALNLPLERQDKNYSLCDAVSFVLMRQHGVTEALTTDRHFEQEGFRRLLS